MKVNWNVRAGVEDLQTSRSKTTDLTIKKNEKQVIRTQHGSRAKQLTREYSQGTWDKSLGT